MRGRVIAAPAGLAVRPTASKLRQAFFNILSNIVPESRFVDVCAGSGLMGMEALSRGAKSLIAVEENRAFAQAIKDNLKTFRLEDVSEVIAGDARKVLPVLVEAEADIIFADPPYKSSLGEAIVQLVDKHTLLSPGGILALEHAVESKLPDALDRLSKIDERKYGQTAITFYRRSEK